MTTNKYRSLTIIRSGRCLIVASWALNMPCNFGQSACSIETMYIVVINICDCSIYCLLSSMFVWPLSPHLYSIIQSSSIDNGIGEWALVKWKQNGSSHNAIYRARSFTTTLRHVQCLHWDLLYHVLQLCMTKSRWYSITLKHKQFQGVQQ